MDKKEEMMGFLKRVSQKATFKRREAIVQILQEHCIPYEIQKGTYEGEKVRNIIVPVKENCSKKVSFCAHYDVFSGSKGALDNGCAISILLSLIKEGFPYTVIFTDKEETGGYGANIYGEIAKEKTIINLDFCGIGSIVVDPFKLKDKELVKPLMEEKMWQKYNIKEMYLPPSDASVFSLKYDISVMTICALPEDNIFKYMHCGSRDNINYVDMNVVQKIRDYIAEML